MSITVSNCVQICNSPLNLSSSKQLFSFSKSNRFPAKESKSVCNSAFYPLPETKDKRSAGIGYGKRLDFSSNSNKNPPPNKYEIKSDFQASKEKHLGFQFGVSRDKMVQGSILGAVNSKNPGPGKYELGNTLSNIKFTMRPKTQDDIMILNKFTPGPGNYPPLPSINEKGKYPISKYANSCATLFNPPRSKRFPEFSGNKVPGPGNYPVDFTGIQKDGKYQLSNQHNSGVRSFPHELRVTFSTSELSKIPGPGNYRLPSEFGYYESKNAKAQDQAKTEAKKEEKEQ